MIDLSPFEWFVLLWVLFTVAVSPYLLIRAGIDIGLVVEEMIRCIRASAYAERRRS